MARQVLGRGLGALIQEADSVDQSGVRNLPIASIKPNPFQPRRQFDDEKLAELAASIKEHGVIQPLIVRERGEGYELVAGERRWRAAQLAGLTEVPVVIKGLNDVQMMQIALVENLQREDLNPLEEALAYSRLIGEFSMTQEEIALTVGKSRPAVANTLRLLHLPEEIQESVSRGTISMGHARAILGLEDRGQQIAAWEKVINDQLSVRETEKLVESLKEPRPSSRSEKKKPILQQDLELQDIEDRLKRYYGTRIRISPGKTKGKIEIEYYGEEDLERLLELLER